MNTIVQDTLLALAAIAVLQIGITGARAETRANPPVIEEIIVIAPAPTTATADTAQPPRS